MKSRATILQFVLGVLLAAVLCGNLALSIRGEAKVALPLLMLEYGLLLVGLVVSVAIHEIGHVVGAWIAKFDIRSVAVLRLEVRRIGSRFRFRIAPKMRLGGFVRAFPPDSDHLAARMGIFIAGGPILSLLLVGVAFVIDQVTAKPPYGSPFEAHVPAVASMAFLVSSLLVLPGTLIPMRSASGVQSDMSVLLQLAQKGERRERLVALYLVGRQAFDERPRAWTPSLLEALLRPADGSPSQLSAELFNYYAARDHGRVEVARVHLEEAARVAGALGDVGGVSAKLTSLLLSFECARAGDLKAAEEHMAEYRRGETYADLLDSTASLAEAALMVARSSHMHEVRRKIDEAREKTSRYQKRFGASQAMSFDLIDELEREAGAVPSW